MPKLSMDQLFNDLGPAGLSFLFVVKYEFDSLSNLKVAQASARIASIPDLEWTLPGTDDVNTGETGTA